MTHEYRVKVTIRNNLILAAIERAGFSGYGMQTEFARFSGINIESLNALVAMRERPINRSGEFTQTAKRLMEVLGASPKELWTDRQLSMRLDKNTGEFTVDETSVGILMSNHAEAMTLPDPSKQYDQDDLRIAVQKILDGDLFKDSPRLRKVLMMKFGIDCEESTMETIGAALDVSAGRANQLVHEALSRIYYNSDRLRAFVEGEG